MISRSSGLRRAADRFLTSSRQQSNLYRRGFWLLNAICLVVYLVTGLETTRFTIMVSQGECQAQAGARFVSVPCPFMTGGGRVGLYNLVQPAAQPWVSLAPLDLLRPPTAWVEITVRDHAGAEKWQAVLGDRGLVTWSGLAQRWRSLLSPAQEHIVAYRPVTGTAFTIDATLHRPHDRAGILLVDESGSGLVFVAEEGSRLGSWWTFADGQAVTPLRGIPLEKSAAQQLLPLLRRLLWAQQGGLLLYLLAIILRRWRRWPRLPRWSPGPAAAAALCLFAFGFSLWFAVDVLERAPHFQDSVAYLFQAETLAEGRLWVEAPPLPRFFAHDFLLVRDGRWFGKYPPGWPALLAGGAGLGVPWVVNPLLAALTVALLFRLARDLFGRRLALLAALLLAMSPFFLFMAGSLMAHPAELFWLTFFLLLWLRAAGLDRPVGARARVGYGLGAGVVLGAAFLTRQLTAVAVGVPFVGLTLLLRWPRRAGGFRFWWRHLAPAGWLAPGLLLAGALLLLHQYALTGDARQDPRLLYWPFDRVGFAPDIGEAGNVANLSPLPLDEPLLSPYAVAWAYDAAQPPRGHTPARGIFNLTRNWWSLLLNVFGWPPLFSLGFAWLALFRRRPVGLDYVLLLTALCLAGAYIFYWHAGLAYGPRYLFATLPFWILLTARGVELLAAVTGRWPVFVLLLVLIGGNLTLTLPTRADDYRDYNFVDPDRRYALTAAVEPPALVFVPASDTAWWEYGVYFPENDPALSGPILFARDLGGENETLRRLYPERSAYILTPAGLRPWE